MIEQLFGSKTRVKLLRLFFSNPNRSFYVREITRIVDEQINSVRRELANMLSLGIITSDSSNNKLYYEVNQDYEYFKALQSMFSEIVEDEPEEEKTPKKDPKTTSKNTKAKPEEKKQDKEKDSIVQLPESKHWAKAGNIAGIAYSGVYTRDESSGVDILIIGDVVVSTIESVISELEKEKNKELRYAVIEPGEWKYRRQVRDKFWLQFMAAKKQIVLDREEVFNNK
jgi:hypothetical protein